MHRETLSRSILYSHNLIGKPIASLTCRSITLQGNHARTQSSQGGKGRIVEISPSRRYHRSWEKRVQSVTKSILAEASEKTPELEQSPPLSSTNAAQPIKLFNIRAKDILSMPDEPLSKTTRIVQDGEDSSITNRTMLDSKISTARSVEELLTLSSEEELTLKHACSIISRLGNLTQTKNDPALAQKVQSDMRFIRIFNLIQRGNHSQFPHTLLQALTGLQKLGMETSLEVSRLLERELSWSMRRCPLRFLAKSVRILHDNSRSNSGQGSFSKQEDNAKEQDVLALALQVLHRRWIEAISGSDFISLFQIIDLLDDERKLKLEERAADVAHQFSPPEMLKMFVVLGTKKRRPTPLLRALAFHFSKAEHKINAKEAIELIYALNELTFADPILMNRLCTDLAEEIPRVKNSALISSLMTSLGQMRYKNKDILFAVDEWIMKNLQDLRVFDFAAWLQASATLDYHSGNMPSFCGKAREVLNLSSASCPTEWVNIVHSFVLLNEYNCEMISSVLNPTFVDSIEGTGPKSLKQKLKLLNINYTASQLKGKDYKGDFLNDEKVKDWTLTLVNSSDEKLSKLVVDSLATFLPPQKYLMLNVQKESGVFVDAQCFFDSRMTPVTIEVAKTKPSSEIKQIAFVVEGYPAMCIGLKQRTGNSALNKRILESENLVVVTVPYTEFAYNEKLVKRVQYLEQKIKALSNLGESSAT